MKKLLIALAAIVGIVGEARAQPYPSRPITMIIPYATGGSTDAIGRIMAERMRVSLGQTVVAENATGANGSIGVGRAARSAPDGYTISLGAWPTHVVNGAIMSLTYDVLNDFEPVALLPTQPLVIVAKTAMDWSSISRSTWSSSASTTASARRRSSPGTDRTMRASTYYLT